MLGTIDLAVIGLSTLCAVGSTLTYLLFLRKQGSQPKLDEASAKSHSVDTTEMREQIERGKTTLQHVLEARTTDRAQTMERYRDMISGLERDDTAPTIVRISTPEGKRAVTVRFPDAKGANDFFAQELRDRGMLKPLDQWSEFDRSAWNNRSVFGLSLMTLPEGHYVHVGKGSWLAQKQWTEADALNVRHYIGRMAAGGVRPLHREPV